MNCYAKDPQTQQDLNASGQTFEQALDVFTQATHGVLKKARKTPVVWEGVFVCELCLVSVLMRLWTEMALDHNVTLANNTIVMYILLPSLLVRRF